MHSTLAVKTQVLAKTLAVITTFFYASNAYALGSSTDCYNTLDNLISSCQTSSGNTAFNDNFNKLKEYCFCGTIQTNSRENTCYSKLNINTDNAEIKQVDITDESKTTCSILATNKTLNSSPYACEIQNASYDKNILSKKVHTFTQNLVDKIADIYGNEFKRDTIERYCPSIIFYKKEWGDYPDYVDSILNNRKYKIIFTTNPLNFVARDKNLNNPDAIIIANAAIYLKDGSNYGNFINLDKEIVLNGTLYGQVNSGLVTLINNGKIIHKSTSQACPDCVFTDAVTTTLNISITQAPCNEAQLLIKECDEEGNCTPIESSLTINDTSYNIPSTGLTLNKDTFNYASANATLAISAATDFTCGENKLEPANGACTFNLAKAGCNINVDDAQNNLLEVYINDYSSIKLSLADTDLTSIIEHVTGKTAPTEEDYSYSTKLKFSAKNRDIKLKTYNDESTPNPDAITVAKGETKEITTFTKLDIANNKILPKISILTPEPNSDDFKIHDLSITFSANPASENGASSNATANNASSVATTSSTTPSSDTTNSSNNESVFTFTIPQEVSITTYPLAFCGDIQGANTQNHDGKIIYANKSYDITKKIVGCPDAWACSDNEKLTNFTYSQEELNNICNSSESFLVEDLSSDDKASYNNLIPSKNIETLNGINPDFFTAWYQSPTAQNATLICPSGDVCASSISDTTNATTDDTTAPLGFIIDFNNLATSKVAFNEVGWYSLSSEKPGSINQHNKKFYYFSPVYTVIADHLSSYDSTSYNDAISNKSYFAVYDYYLNNYYFTLIADAITDANTSASASSTLYNDITANINNLTKKINQSSCPAYLSQKLTSFGFIKAVDAQEKILNNLANEYLTNISRTNHTFKSMFFKVTTDAVTSSNITISNNEIDNDNTLLNDSYLYNLGFGFRSDFTLTNDYKEPQSSYIGLVGSIDFKIAPNVADTANFESIKIHTNNNISDELNGNYNITYENIDTDDQKYLHTFPINEYNPITAYKGRLVSEVIFSRNTPIHVPIYIHFYNGSTWQVSPDSCSFLNLYNTDIAESNSFIFTNGSNTQADITAEGTYKLDNSNDITLSLEDAYKSNIITPSLTKNFISGKLLLRASVPNTISASSFSTFIFRGYKNVDSSKTRVNYLDYLFDDTTSRGGFVYKGKTTNIRILDGRLIFK